jgi:threonine synthase
MLTPFVYRCSLCGKTYARDEVRYLCPTCSVDYRPGMPLKGVLLAEFDGNILKTRFTSRESNWNTFLPVEERFFPPYACGNTPFTRAEALGNHLGFPNVWIKNDGLNPSGSLKDRASFLVVAEANRLGEHSVVTASTGNAASALAAVCASAQKEAIIFIPRSAPRAKLVQMKVCGARITPVEGTYDDAFRLSLEYTAAHGGLNRNTAYHPLTIEGKKTVGLEIFAQNGYKVPDVILVPVGDGVIIAGVWKAFHDLLTSGITNRMPRLVAVQAERSDAIHRLVVSGQYHDASDPTTIADSISVRTPSNAWLAQRAVVETNGFSLTVTDDEISDAQGLLGCMTGIFAEPSSSATVAALKKIHGTNQIDAKEHVVLLITGHGLKDVESVRIPSEHLMP